MFCPECGGEYREGVERCADCEVALVLAPIAEPQPDDDFADDLVTVLETPDLSLLTVIKGLLDSAEIPYVVQGEEGVHQLPLGPVGGLGFFRSQALGATLRVRQDDVEAAEGLISEQVVAPAPPEP